MSIVHRRAAARRGMLLLVALGMLAMFSLIAITFVVIASHNMRSARVLQRLEIQAEWPDRTTDRALLQMLRGTNNRGSAMRGHDLGSDMYSRDRLRGVILGYNPNGPVAGGQLIEIVPDPTVLSAEVASRRVGCVLTMLGGTAKGRSTRIVGFQDGPAPTYSLLIVGFDGINFAANPGTGFLINGAAFAGTGFGHNVTTTGDPLRTLDAMLTEDLNGNGVLDPGEDLNGNGAIDPVGPPYALAPNPTAFVASGAYRDPAGPGGANEDYDAVDPQNMLLALVDPDSHRTIIPSMHRPALIHYWFTRKVAQLVADGVLPDMETAWRAVLEPSTAPDAPGGPITRGLVLFRRKFILRPSLGLHPNFDGGNPTSARIAEFGTLLWPLWRFERGYYWEVGGWMLPVQDFDGDTVSDPIQGAWDVDNDGDGEADSIWLNLALPVRQTADGRKYVPLVAVLCIDRDGCLNLNAHGSPPQTLDAYYNSILAPRLPAQAMFANASPAAPLPRGQGYGPAEINLAALFPAGPNALRAYRRLLFGNRMLDGRYGETGVAPIPMPGRTGFDHPLSQNRLFEHWSQYTTDFYGLTTPYSYWGFLDAPPQYAPNAFGSPPDLNGNGGVGLDLRGQPIYPLAAEPGEHIDHQYEMRLSYQGTKGQRTGTLTDNGFTPEELERLLRPFDRDARLLSNRPQQLLKGIAGANLVSRRHEVTTESWHVPSSNMVLPPRLRAQLESVLTAAPSLLPVQAIQDMLPNNRVYTLRDLVLVKLARALVNPADPPATIAIQVRQVRDDLKHFLPMELLRGLPMDLNRPFAGNGIDDDGDGVVDEPPRIMWDGARFVIDAAYPGEFLAGEAVPRVDANGLPVGPVRFEHANGIDVTRSDGTGGPANAADNALARQLYARQLYILMMTLVDIENLETRLGGIPADPVLSAQLLAQWAVNVVDFRDRDSIMTPFEYDTQPFIDNNGDGFTWDVDCVVGSPDDDETVNTTRRLVWGCERPELLITESLAFHDRRTEDLESGDKYTDDDPPDPNYDNKKRPKGSLFIELYNPWAWREPKSGELYDSLAGGVHLNRMAPGSNSPVWRLAIPKDPADPDSVLDRTVYFADLSGGMDVTPEAGEVQHYPSVAGPTIVRPGRYAVIGPGDLDHPDYPTTTFLGLATGGADLAGDTTTTRHIALDPAAPFDVKRNRDPTTGDLEDLGTQGRLQPVVTLAVDKARNIRPGGNQAGPAPDYLGNLRLSVSEPKGGYPMQDSGGVIYDDVRQEYTTAWPQPLDYNTTDPAFPNFPDFYNNVLVHDTTHPHFRTVRLERLANPTIPWDEFSNPYIEIDSAIVDLTTFNGVPNRGHATDEPLSLDTMDDFCSRERGENNAVAGVPRPNNLWTQEMMDPAAPSDPLPNEAAFTIAGHKFTEGLHHTLGYLNWDFNGGSANPGGPRDATWGVEYKGTSMAGPFPWLAWNNRPFVSHLELLKVPAVDAAGLLRHPATVTPVVPGLTNRVYSMVPAVAAAYTPWDAAPTWTSPFPHLLDFFESHDKSLDESVVLYRSPQFHRLLDYVHVPSRYADTQLQINPLAAATPGHPFQPPFDHISRYREPGRINLNTVFSLRVWRGLMNFFPIMDASAAWRWNEFRLSRRGASGYAGWLPLDGRFPTRFETPYRSAGGRYLTANLSPGAPSGPDLLPNREVDASLLRERLDGSGPTGSPLLQFNALLDAPPLAMVADTNRNPSFRYQALERLGNLTTTRSNVYAIWITVGYFEVEKLTAGYDPTLYPGGYTLGRELGVESGEITRHRAFYIIDRSIPVAFERGMDHNVEDTVLLRRYIE